MKSAMPPRRIRLFPCVQRKIKAVGREPGCFRKRLIMVKDLIHDPLFLAGKSSDADISDIQTANDLLDTLKAHRETCVGMAANMIGVRKRIIAFADDSGKNVEYTLMLNPELISRSEPYGTEEGCLSLLGDPRKFTRYNKIKVKYVDLAMKPKIKTYIGFTAQIIQHEIDHCAGVLI